MKRDAHLTTLDGLRGTAAIAVVFTHAEEFLQPLRVPGGSMAVDLFFMLSGYVLTHAYAPAAANGVAARHFMLARFIRLTPLYLIGAALASIQLAFGWSAGRNGLDPVGAVSTVIALWTMLPSPIPNDLGELFALNGPRWSLFYELVANLALIALWQLRRWKPPLVGLAILTSIFFLAAVHHRHSIELGWSADTFLLGFARAFASFFIGCLLRAALPPVQRVSVFGRLLPFFILPILMLDSQAHPSLAAVLVLAVFPLIIVAGARYRAPSGARLNGALGLVSYPLYVIHVPVFGLASLLLTRLGRSAAAFAPALGLGLLCCLIAASWALGRWFDVPIRALLKRHLLSQRGALRPRRVASHAQPG